MGAVKKISFAIGVWAGVAAAMETCAYLPARTGVGRDSGLPYDSKDSWCPDQISTCAKICGGNALTNTCELGSPTCYECVCADGSTPDLSLYVGTIPQMSCQLRSSNCWSAPGGGINNGCDTWPECGSIDLSDPIFEAITPAAAEPTTTPLLTTLSTIAAESAVETTTSVPEEIPAVTVTSTSTSTTTPASTSTFYTSVYETLSSSSAIESSTFSSSSSSILETSSARNTTTTASRTTAATTQASATATSSTFSGAAVMTSIPLGNAAIVGAMGFVLAVL